MPFRLIFPISHVSLNVFLYWLDRPSRRRLESSLLSLKYPQQMMEILSDEKELQHISPEGIKE